MSVIKVVVIGPESTGKSTVSAALAAALHTVWVPEYARAYLEGLGRPYEEADLLQITQGQLAEEDRLASEAKGVLICDTDLYVIKVWSEHSYGRVAKEVLEAIAVRKYDLYLLTNIDLPWSDDPLREHGSPEERNYFYNQYHDIVLNSGVPFAVLSGDESARLQQALRAVDELVKR